MTSSLQPLQKRQSRIGMRTFASCCTLMVGQWSLRSFSQTSNLTRIVSIKNEGWERHSLVAFQTDEAESSIARTGPALRDQNSFRPGALIEQALSLRPAILLILFDSAEGLYQHHALLARAG
jgi:hypothetical protein